MMHGKMVEGLMTSNPSTTGAVFSIDPPSFFYVARNDCVGSFCLSDDLKNRLDLSQEEVAMSMTIREHPNLVGSIMMFGEEFSSGPGSKIVLEKLPIDALYEIESDCGMETIKIIARSPVMKYLRSR